MKRLFLILALMASPAWGQSALYMQYQMQNDDRADAETNAFIAQEKQQAEMQELKDELRQQALDRQFQKSLEDEDNATKASTYFH